MIQGEPAIYFDSDERPYTKIIEKWVRRFRDSLSKTPQESPLSWGDNSGFYAQGIKIFFDGYGENENDVTDRSFESYQVFVHVESLKMKEYPEHDGTPWCVFNRPDEEVCIYVWYDARNDKMMVIPFEDNGGTNLKPKVIYNLIDAIDRKYYP